MRQSHNLAIICSSLLAFIIYSASFVASADTVYVKEVVNLKDSLDASATTPLDLLNSTEINSTTLTNNTSADLDVAPEEATEDTSPRDIVEVPFFSQFNDISDPNWKKIGCGIASLAMLIDFYKPDSISVDNLLDEGITAGAYISDAGWSHAGLISLAKAHGLTGDSHGLSNLSMDEAFSELKNALTEGPVIASVHYTFQPTNPIPHLVVVTDVDGEMVYYNDPAEVSGGGSVSVEQFKSAWKKRYIEIRANT